MKHYIILLCTLCIIIFSCSQKSTFVLPEYQNIVINESTLAIAPLPAKPQLEYPDDLGTELGFEISDDLYLSSLNEKLPVSMRSLSKFEEVVSISYKNIPKLQPCSLKLKNDELISLSLPVGKIKFDSVQTDFTLFMDKLNIKITKDRDVSSSLSKNYTVSGNHPDNASYTNIKRYTYYLVQEANYAFYDNKTGKIISYGKIHSKSTLSSVLREFVYHKCIEDLARAILKDTPFK